MPKSDFPQPADPGPYGGRPGTDSGIYQGRGPGDYVTGPPFDINWPPAVPGIQFSDTYGQYWPEDGKYHFQSTDQYGRVWEWTRPENADPYHQMINDITYDGGDDGTKHSVTAVGDGAWTDRWTDLDGNPQELLYDDSDSSDASYDDDSNVTWQNIPLPTASANPPADPNEQWHDNPDSPPFIDPNILHTDLHDIPLPGDLPVDSGVRWGDLDPSTRDILTGDATTLPDHSVQNLPVDGPWSDPNVDYGGAEFPQPGFPQPPDPSGGHEPVPPPPDTPSTGPVGPAPHSTTSTTDPTTGSGTQTTPDPVGPAPHSTDPTSGSGTQTTPSTGSGTQPTSSTGSGTQTTPDPVGPAPHSTTPTTDPTTGSGTQTTPDPVGPAPHSTIPTSGPDDNTDYGGSANDAPEVIHFAGLSNDSAAPDANAGSMPQAGSPTTPQQSQADGPNTHLTQSNPFDSTSSGSTLHPDLLDPTAPGPTLDHGLVDQIQQNPHLVNAVNQNPDLAHALEQDPSSLDQVTHDMGLTTHPQSPVETSGVTDPSTTSGHDFHDPSLTDPGHTEPSASDHGVDDHHLHM
ncbi:MAG: hypothetical protein JOZ19_12715 [Rubrobacter sp.]|nr:hypothetical protein [Rubrobacter sp.]